MARGGRRSRRVREDERWRGPGDVPARGRGPGLARGGQRRCACPRCSRSRAPSSRSSSSSRRAARRTSRIDSGAASRRSTASAPRASGGARTTSSAASPQDNGREEDWPTFYARRRLEPQLRMAADRGRTSPEMRRGFSRLFARMRELVGPSEPPARLHGDLWGGNCHVDEHGAPVLIDPAVYGGHREMDLAMMQLFGGFSERVFAAYDEAYPLAEGWRERVPLYQLYPLMVHVNLFGGGYAASVERVLSRYA
ncbi:MAG: fructosamine kinase family protein [Sandaracinaceae bacterium]|nr:fructosamine kinase family protein [Sandaracinaceae bacterium]